MLRSFIRMLKRRKLVLFLSAIILLLGIYSYVTMPKQEMPDLVVPLTVVEVIAPGVSADEMVELTEPINNVFDEYKEVEYVQSVVLDNVMIAQVYYDFSTRDTKEVTSRIEEDVLRLDLGDRITNISFRTDFNIPHVVYAFSGAEHRYLVQEAELLREEILRLDNVNSVSMDNPIVDYVDVLVPNQSLAFVSIVDVYGILYANSQSIPLGSINEIPVTIDSAFDEVSDIENLVIGSRVSPETGEVIPIYLKSVSSIELRQMEGKKYFYNGDEAVFLTVLFDEDIDHSIVGKELKQIVEEFESTAEITEMNFGPDYVDYQIGQAMSSLLICILIVMVVVLIGLGLRNSIAIAIIIPIIVFGTIFTIDLLGYKLERVSIAGIIISIGILVDNSIVVSDAIQYNLDSGKKVFTSAIMAVRDNSVAILASTLTTMAAFIPLILLPGLAGQMAKSLPITVMIAIGLSYIFSVTVTPVLATYLFKKRKRRTRRSTVYWIGSAYQYPKQIVYLSFMMFFVALFFVVKMQPIDIFPADEKTEFYINYRSQDTSLEATSELAQEIANVLDNEESIEDYYYSVGGGLPAFSGTTTSVNEVNNEGRFFVKSDVSFDEVEELVDSLSKTFKFENAEVEVRQIELGMSSAPIELSVTSPDLEYLLAVSTQLDSVLKNHEEVESYSIRETQYYDKYTFEVNRGVLTSLGATLIELQNFIYVNLNGLSIPAFYMNDELVNIYVHSDVTDIEQLLELEFKGSPLSALLNYSEEEAAETIYMQNNEHQLYVKITPNIMQTLRLENDIIDYLNLYDVTVSREGDSKLVGTLFGDLGTALLLVVVLIYLILFIQFNSFLQPFIVFLTIPLSLVGSFAMMIAFDTPISLMAMLGIISLIGVVVNTGILLVEYINKAVKKGLSVQEACVQAVQRRFRAIVLASTTTVLGLLPMMINGGEFFSPLAIVFIGGIISSMVLTIFVVPSFYILLRKST